MPPDCSPEYILKTSKSYDKAGFYALISYREVLFYKEFAPTVETQCGIKVPRLIYGEIDWETTERILVIENLHS